MYNLCFNNFVVPEAVENFKCVEEAGFTDFSIQFILLSYDESELGRFKNICKELPPGAHISLHPNSFPFNSLNFAEGDEVLRKYFVDFILIWVPKFVQAAISHGLIVQNIVLHAGFQVIDCDISSRENALRREKALRKIASSYKDISRGFESLDCTLTFENGVRSETSHGRLLCKNESSIQAFEIPYTFEEIKYLIDNSVNITFDFFKYFETLDIPDLDKRVDLTLNHLREFLSLDRVYDIQISRVQDRPESFKRNLIKELRATLQGCGFKGSLTLEGYWNKGVDNLIEDIKAFIL